MTESINDQVSLLRQMTDGYNGRISANEREAIALAVRVISVIESVNPLGGMSVYKIMTGVGIAIDGRHFQESSLLECFSEAGRELENEQA